MNCINHPTAEVTAYCQYCGKPLCTECVRSVGGVFYCEPCLGARLGIPVGGQVPSQPFFPDRHPNPALAALLGFIPGVGAMYNGQFVKALVHVLIFAVFVSLSNNSGIFGLFVAAWVFYQVFDAHQTAKARRDGLPLPNPFGLNDLGMRLGIPQTPTTPPYSAGFTAGAPQSGAAEPSASQPAAYTSGGSYNAAYTPPLATPYVSSPPAAYPTPNPPYVPVPQKAREPIGAIVLIVIGLVLLFQTLGIFRGEWVDRAWPLLIVGAGAWLLYRRTRETPPPGGVQ
jgi:hypothetical protein